MAAQRFHSVRGVAPQDEYTLQLIQTQLAFGLAYVEAARAAYLESRTEFAELARDIALNSYHSAARFAARLAREVDSTLRDQLDRFRREMQAVWPDTLLSREIA